MSQLHRRKRSWSHLVKINSNPQQFIFMPLVAHICLDTDIAVVDIDNRILSKNTPLLNNYCPFRPSLAFCWNSSPYINGRR